MYEYAIECVSTHSDTKGCRYRKGVDIDILESSDNGTVYESTGRAASGEAPDPPRAIRSPPESTRMIFDFLIFSSEISCVLTQLNLNTRLKSQYTTQKSVHN